MDKLCGGFRGVTASTCLQGGAVNVPAKSERMDFHKRYTFVQVNASAKFFETHKARIKVLENILEELQKALEEA